MWPSNLIKKYVLDYSESMLVFPAIVMAKKLNSYSRVVSVKLFTGSVAYCRINLVRVGRIKTCSCFPVLSSSLFEPGFDQELRPTQLHKALLNLNANEELVILT